MEQNYMVVGDENDRYFFSTREEAVKFIENNLHLFVQEPMVAFKCDLGKGVFHWIMSQRRWNE